MHYRDAIAIMIFLGQKSNLMEAEAVLYQEVCESLSEEVKGGFDYE